MTATSASARESTVEFRDPLVRLRTLFDHGTLRTLTGQDDSGVLTGAG
jgi:acetyl-CoA/propionyl-CoA carboxylase carboxyl transferase subunit